MEEMAGRRGHQQYVTKHDNKNKMHIRCTSLVFRSKKGMADGLLLYFRQLEFNIEFVLI